jgi:hypothetical protein
VRIAAVYVDFVADLPSTMIDLAGVGVMEVPVMELHSHLTVLALAEAVGVLMRRTGRSFESGVEMNRP